MHFTTEYFLIVFPWHITRFHGYENNNFSTFNAKEPWHTLSEIRTVEFWWLRNLDSKQWSNCRNLEKLWSSYTCLAYALQAIKCYTSVIQCIMVFNKQLHQKGSKGRPSLKALKAVEEGRIGCSLCDRSPYKRSIKFSVSPHSLLLCRNKSPEKKVFLDTWTKHSPQDDFGWTFSGAMRIEKPE